MGKSTSGVVLNDDPPHFSNIYYVPDSAGYSLKLSYFQPYFFSEKEVKGAQRLASFFLTNVTQRVDISISNFRHFHITN